MGSLRLRFLIVSALSIALSLIAAGLVFVYLFGQNLERRIGVELTQFVNQITAEIKFSKDGSIKPPAGLSDLRFQNAYSGLYWQIEDIERNVVLRSRSLWDHIIPLPKDAHDPGDIHRYFLTGPENSELMVQERLLIIAAPTGARSIRIASALDTSVIKAASQQFAFDIVPYLVALGLFLVVSSAVQMAFGLKPLSTISRKLDAIRDRRSRRLEGPFPVIQRLVGAVNNLLDAQEKNTHRIHARAGDLAHGLKTPLTVLQMNSEKLIEKGEMEIGTEVFRMTELMQGHINHELARSRLTPHPEQRKSDGVISPIVNDIVNTLRKTPKGSELDWQVNLPANCSVKIDPDDLRELIGNIVENACKWAKNSVQIAARVNSNQLEVYIKDDGPGISSGWIDAVMERGKRFDEKVPGSGIGLAIVNEIVDVYELSLKIENRQSSGLRVTIQLPMA